MRDMSLRLWCSGPFAVGLSFGCGASPDEPDANTVSAYFGLHDGDSRRYAAESGLEEVHELRQVPGGAADTLVYDRTVRRGGFVIDDLTLRLRVSTTAGLEIIRLYDCVSRCGELSAPIALLPWPVVEGRALESEVEVTMTGASDEGASHTERHVVQVGATSPLTVPAGTFDAYSVLWSQEANGGEGRSAAMAFAPEVGFLRSEAFDAIMFELVDAP